MLSFLYPGETGIIFKHKGKTHFMERKHDPAGNADDTNRFKDLITDKKIHEHLSNEFDEITEADIDNIVTGDCLLPENLEDCADAKNATNQGTSLSQESDTEESADNDLEPDHGKTTWNVLD